MELTLRALMLKSANRNKNSSSYVDNNQCIMTLFFKKQLWY